MKKLISFLVVVIMVCTFCTPALAAEEKSDTITFEKVNTRISENGLFTLNAKWFCNYGWSGGTNSNYITISASEGLLITSIKATLSLYGSTYNEVGISGGMKQEGEVWESGHTVTVKNINASEFSFIGGTDWCVFNDITVYYEGDGQRYICPHENGFTNGVCYVCGYQCPHDKWKEGVCSVCGYVCPHDSNTCVVCGKELHSLGNGAVGSTLSTGYPEIAFGIGGIAVGMAVMFFIMKKKSKPAIVEGAAADDEE